MTTEITTQEKGGIKALINSDKMREQFARALPKHLPIDRFLRVCLTALTRTPELLNSTPESLMRCLLDLSAMGLEPDGRRAHLIPFKNNRAGTVECTLIVDYKGLAELVMRSGLVSSIHADAVCDNDIFEVDRGEIKTHKVNYKTDRGAEYAYYCIIRFKDGGEKSEVMGVSDVLKIRDKSQGYISAIKYGKDNPWLTQPDEMGKKTVFKRASKWVPLSPEIRTIIDREDDLENERSMRNATPRRDVPAFITQAEPATESDNLFGAEVEE